MIAPTNPIIRCRFCGGYRPTSNGSCQGCAMPVANARVVATRNGPPKMKCPGCKSVKSEALDNHRFLCHACGVEFERLDVDYLDSRPDRNAEKREALNNLMRDFRR